MLKKPSPRVIEGLRKLCAERPDRPLRCSEIAARCGCSSRYIEQLEKAALSKAAQIIAREQHRRPLHEMFPDFIPGSTSNAKCS